MMFSNTICAAKTSGGVYLERASWKESEAVSSCQAPAKALTSVGVLEGDKEGTQLIYKKIK
jgi:hypothetical protein